MPGADVPTGTQHAIAHGDQRVTVTEVGATLRTYEVDGRAVVDGFGVHEMSMGGRGQVLAPWPNRLEDGRYTFEGVQAHAPLDEPDRGNAIHGLVRWLPWVAIARTEASVTMGCVLHPSPAYPWKLHLETAFVLDADGLTIATRASNGSSVPAPFGLGFHPYLTVGTERVDEASLRIPARRILLTDDRALPVGEQVVEGSPMDFTAPAAVGPLRLDTAYTDLIRDPDGHARVTLEQPEDGPQVTVWVDTRFDHLMVYTGDTLEPADRRRGGIAIEPMTCPPNALRSGVGVIRLEPGTSWTGSWGITATGSPG